MSTIVKADITGALTLPAEFCREAGLESHAELTAEIRDGMIILGPVLPPIWEQIVNLTADASLDELLKPPTDGASQHDHYLYGTPKRPE